MTNHPHVATYSELFENKQIIDEIGSQAYIVTILRKDDKQRTSYLVVAPNSAVAVSVLEQEILYGDGVPIIKCEHIFVRSHEQKDIDTLLTSLVDFADRDKSSMNGGPRATDLVLLPE